MQVSTIHFAASQARQAQQIAADLWRDLSSGADVNSASVSEMFVAIDQKLGLAETSLDGVSKSLREVLG
jgi:hypothetical protein